MDERSKMGKEVKTYITDKFVPEENLRPVRILQITGGMCIGGAETMIMHLYRKINKDEIQFDFVSFAKEKCHYDEEIKRLGGRIFYVPPPQNDNPLKFIKDIYRVVKNNGPYRAVHAHTSFNSGLALLAARLAKVKCRVCHAHTTGSYDDKGLIRKLYFFIMRILIKLNANKKVACSKAAGQFLFGGKSKAGKDFLLLHNAFDLIPYRNVNKEEIRALRNELNIKDNELVIGHVGTFARQKNHVFLIKLAETLKNRNEAFKLLLIGRGSLKSELQAMVKEKGLDEHVIFLGVQTNIPLYMHMFDVFVFPSLFEGLGIVLIEAQAAGTPCVISNTIPAECDMDMGLIKTLDLKERTESWIDAIIEAGKIKKIPPEHTTRIIAGKGYDLDITAETLKTVYGLA